MKPMALCAVVLLCAVFLLAESTRFWEQTNYAAFEKGALENLSLRADGSLRLGPRFDLLEETDSGYLWGLAEDSRGNLFAGGGSPGHVYKIAPDGTGSLFFETHEMEIHAVAVDRQDRIYAAAAPDGAIYRITPEGTSEVFFDPQTKYIWALAFDSEDNLYVATGDKGEIFRVDTSGQGKPFFSSGEIHIRSLIVDRQDNVLAGTDGNGLILRIRPDGEAFVLYEAPKQEVTALALDAEGNLYAAAVGNKRRLPGQPPQPVPGQPAAVPQQRVTPPPRTPRSLATANLTGGSAVYRIAPEAPPQRIWTSPNDIVYSLAINPQGKLLIGTGNQGRIYQFTSLGSYSLLARSPSSQITALLSGKEGLQVAASNVGRVYRLRREFVSEGTFVSEVFDAGRFSKWGYMQWRQHLPADTAFQFQTRSGNSSRPALNWSPWTEARLDGNRALPQSPAARFFQWKVRLSSSQADRTPALSSVRMAYLPNNVAPLIAQVQNTPPGFRVRPVPVPPQPPPRAMTLLPFGSPAAAPRPPQVQPPLQMVEGKGYLGVRWAASDENEDSLVFSVYIRGETEQEWKLLQDGISGMSYTWDSANFPDGTYTARIVASDAPSNPIQEALSATRESPPFEIDNTPPEILDLQCKAEGDHLQISFRAIDRRSTIQKAEYSLDGGEWRTAFPVTRLSDSGEEEYLFNSEDVSGSEHTVVVRVSDRFENTGVGKVVWKAPTSTSR